MRISFQLNAASPLQIKDFFRKLEVPVELTVQGTYRGETHYYFHRPEHSTTSFVISDDMHGKIGIGMDGLSSYDDYKFFPYLIDTLGLHLNGHSPKLMSREDGKTYSVYERLGAQWIEDCIGEEIASLKVILSVIPRCYLELPKDGIRYVSLEQLKKYGVNLHSSTPRIYGYVQYIMRKGLLPQATEAELEEDNRREELETDVDGPQLVSIGRVMSWQIDGAETWECYSREDTEMLVALGESYQAGADVAGVVLNDLGTIYQEGIGVERDGLKAEYWFKQAYLQGDHLYAPTNLGDLYRKGCGALPISLPLAFEAYKKSEDIYALYRIGQAYEEGWTGAPDREKALYWYRKAAEKKHHLAVRRLEELSSQA